MVPSVTIVNFVPRRVREGQHILHAEVCTDTENERCEFISYTLSRLLHFHTIFLHCGTDNALRKVGLKTTLESNM